MKDKKHKSLMKSYGFTFVETLVVVGIFSFIIIALTSSLIYFYRTNAYSVEQSFAVNSARKGIEFMVRDIREATYSEEGSYPIIDGDENSFSFYSDIDRDNDVERVKYYLDGTTLKKGVTKASGLPLAYDDIDEIVSTVSSDVRNSDQAVSMFRYFDKDAGEIFNVSLNVTDVAFVTVNMIVNINPQRLPNEFTLRSSATLRNLKSNL